MVASVPKRRAVKLPAVKTQRRKAGDEPASPQYRQARRDRGAGTRAQLIEAGLDVFGRFGFEGASTREIAKAAGVNLAAILYHFGGKEGLHLAVAEHIVTSINARIAPALADMAAADEIATPQAARTALIHVASTMIDVMLGSAEAERWARFIVREQMQPTAAFDLIYGFMGGTHALGSRLLATALGRPEDDEVRVRVFTIIGQVLVFRVAQALVMRRLDWVAVGDEERATIKQVVIQNIDAIIEGVKP